MILTFDIGSTVLKAGIIDNKGKLLAHVRTAYNKNYIINTNPALWLNSITNTVSAMDTKVLKNVRAVAVSGNGPTIVPVDEKGKPVCGVMAWHQNKEHALKQEQSQSRFLPMIERFYKTNPQGFKKTKYFLPAAEYINFVLTGMAHAILPTEQFAPYIWTENDILKYKLPVEKFPPFLRLGSVVGQVSKQAAGKTGIPAGLPVVACGTDFLMCLLGTGTIQAGMCCDRTGTSEGINYCSDKKVKHNSLNCLPHIIPGLYNVSKILRASGNVLYWATTLIGKAKGRYDVLFDYINDVPAGAQGVLFMPYFWDNMQRRSSHDGFMDLNAKHEPKHMARAVVESLGLAIRNIIEEMENNFCPIDELIVSGGQANNSIWNQLKADITGKRIMAPLIVDAELLGCACVALVTLKQYGDLTEVCRRLVKINKIYEPRGNFTAVYDEIYLRFKKAAQAFYNVTNVGNK